MPAPSPLRSCHVPPPPPRARPRAARPHRLVVAPITLHQLQRHARRLQPAGHGCAAGRGEGHHVRRHGVHQGAHRSGHHDYGRLTGHHARGKGYVGGQRAGAVQLPGSCLDGDGPGAVGVCGVPARDKLVGWGTLGGVAGGVAGEECQGMVMPKRGRVGGEADAAAHVRRCSRPCEVDAAAHFHCINTAQQLALENASAAPAAVEAAASGSAAKTTHPW
jgi:hypothetical protein